MASGDQFAGSVKSLRVGRSFFPVGVNNHVCTINSEAPTYITDVLIKAFADNVENIVVFLNERNADGAAWPVTIEHQNDTGDTSITNIHIHADIKGPVNPRIYLGPETTREYFRIGAAFNSSGTLQATTTCVTDNVFIYGSPIRLSLTDAIFNLPTIQTVPSRIFCNFEDILTSTKGFNFVKGDTLKAKSSGPLAANPAKVDLRSSYPSGGAFLVNLFINKNLADNTMADSLSRGNVLLIAMDGAGVGSVISSSALYSNSRGAAPTAGYTIANGQLDATGAGSSTGSEETNLSVQPIGGASFNVIGRANCPADSIRCSRTFLIFPLLRLLIRL